MDGTLVFLLVMAAAVLVGSALALGDVSLFSRAEKNLEDECGSEFGSGYREEG